MKQGASVDDPLVPHIQYRHGCVHVWSFWDYGQAARICRSGLCSASRFELSYRLDLVSRFACPTCSLDLLFLVRDSPSPLQLEGLSLCLRPHSNLYIPEAAGTELLCTDLGGSMRNARS